MCRNGHLSLCHSFQNFGRSRQVGISCLRTLHTGRERHVSSALSFPWRFSRCIPIFFQTLKKHCCAVNWVSTICLPALKVLLCFLLGVDDDVFPRFVPGVNDGFPRFACQLRRFSCAFTKRCVLLQNVIFRSRLVNEWITAKFSSPQQSFVMSLVQPKVKAPFPQLFPYSRLEITINMLTMEHVLLFCLSISMFGYQEKHTELFWLLLGNGNELSVRIFQRILYNWR